MIKLFLFAALLTCSGCDNSGPQKVIGSAGDNHTELEKVINHFEKEANAEKIQAARYLIENMDSHFSHDGEEVWRFDVIYDVLDSLHKNKIKVPIASPLLKNIWDSLVNKYGKPVLWETEEFYDHEYVKSDFLINNIDWAYKLWKTSNWSKGVSFDQFSEYLLPYRNGTERLEFWREHLFNKYAPFRDTVKTGNRFDAASRLNGELRKTIALNHIMRQYPYDMTVSQMEKARRGACRQLVFYTASSMRANGIPVGVDFTPCWGDLDRGHEWNVLLKEDGTMFPFNAAGADFLEFAKSPYRFSKVYRMSFAKVEQPKAPADEVPSFLINDHALDVTEEYTKCHDFEIELTKPNRFNNANAVLCTFKAKSWSAQDWGKITDNKVRFFKIGSDLIYVVMYYKGGNYYPASAPFILTKAGKLNYISSAAKNTDLILYRKYPYFPINTVNAKPLLGGKFQVANKADFSDSLTLFTIDSIPVKMEEIPFTQAGKYRYVRYLTAKGQKTNLAELEVFGLQKNVEAKLTGTLLGAPVISPELGFPIQLAFDGDPETYFSGNPDSLSWAGIDLGKPQAITKIRFCPRSDVNFIVPGDIYELRFWNGEQWQLIGKQTASTQSLLFKKVPEGQLYILHDLSRGVQERIFTYENGKQIWW